MILFKSVQHACGRIGSQVAFWALISGCAAPAVAPKYSSALAAPQSDQLVTPEPVRTQRPGPSRTPRTTGIAAPVDEDEAHADDDDDEDDGTPQDEIEDDADKAVGTQPLQSHPLDGVAEAELERRLTTEPASLGSMSIGLPNAGRLLNAVQLPESPYWTRVAPGNAWATQETIDYLTRSLAKVHEAYPDAPKLYVGHISAQKGGYLAPHLSHQAGRDIDISFFYSGDARWYLRARSENLDAALTWTFIRALITETDLRFVLIDQSLHAPLRAYAENLGEDKNWLDAIFRGDGSLRGPLIRHAPGHATHLHIRFENPVAQETARRCYRLLLKHRYIEPPTYYALHKVKKGETLGKLAKRYGTTIPALKRLNGLKSSLIRSGRLYKIPRRGNAPAPAAVKLFPRLLPPEKAQ